MSRTTRLLYLICLFAGAVFVLVYRGPGHEFVRGYVGDFLVVQAIYLILRFGIGARYRYPLAGAVLLLGVFTEIFQMLAAGSIPRTAAAELTIGSTFDPLDIAAYALGIVAVLLIERWLDQRAQARLQDAVNT